MAGLTRIAVGNDQTFTGHPACLMHQHVRPLVVAVVGNEQTGRIGMMGVHGFEDLGGLGAGRGAHVHGLWISLKS